MSSNKLPPGDTKSNDSKYMALWDLEALDLDKWARSAHSLFPKGE
jgi:hypothetical protein